MKTLLIFLSVLLGSGCWGQEFTVHENGLIYSDHSVQKLKHIVDSLNLKFKVCDANKLYYSLPQAKAHYVYLEKNKVKQARADMDNNMPFDQFMKKYGNAKVEKDLLVTKLPYTDYDNNKWISLRSPEFDDQSYSVSFKNGEQSEKLRHQLKGKWLYNYDEKSEYSTESISAFYFIDDLERKPLAGKYSRMIQYSDCLVDTTAQVFHDKAVDSGVRIWRDTVPNKISAFLDYANAATQRPPEFDYEKYFSESANKKEQEKLAKQEEIAYAEHYRAMQKWDSMRIAKLDFMNEHDSKFTNLLTEAISEVRSKNLYTSDEFEMYVSRYASKDAALEMKRNRRVIGGCSQDQSPRYHALNIAILSAETTKWEIFLRAHLDIMNDRFSRVSDGSYAYGDRQTYIKELEVLDVSVPDLILGICFRIDNAANNHYFGSIGRVGRALSESTNARALESDMLNMIADNSLDDYNRVLIYYLFDNYNYYLKDEQQRAKNLERLGTAVAKMPSYLASRIKLVKS